MINVNENELKYILKNTPPSQNIMICGKHGIGKSEIVKNYYESVGSKVVIMFCSQAADPGDIIGLPYSDDEKHKTEFSLPWWFPTDGTPVVLFLDELNRARPEILQVVMDLTLNRKLAGKSLPEGSRIISAVNNGDEYQLTELDPALLSRFNVYNFTPTSAEWIRWATANDIDSTVVSFISMNSKYLDPDESKPTDSMERCPDRRAWCRVSDIMNGVKKFDIPLKKMICGIVGAEAGVKFFEYAKESSTLDVGDLFDDFDNAEDKLAGYDVTSMIGFNDVVCSYAENELSANFSGNSNRIANGLYKYITSLCSGKLFNGEIMAHFISNVESGRYSYMSILISSNSDTLEKVINDFIMNSGKTL